MQLEEWREHNRVSQRALADEAGVSQPTLSRYLKGESTPNVEFALRIKRITGGAVTLEDWERT
jgi:transcriptional regulator with XRE-family HTH domain